MVKACRGPNWASVGLAQEALVGMRTMATASGLTVPAIARLVAQCGERARIRSTGQQR
jgi:hypothetical protein